MSVSRTSGGPRERAWPVALLLEELRLRSRRVIIGELERCGVWPDRARHQRHSRTQRALGERLRDGALRAALGDPSFSILGSRTAFQSANRLVAARVPLVLAFGYELGAGLCRISDHGDEAAAERVGTRCAVFNLAIAMFDVVCDTTPEVSDRLGGLVDERLLRELAVDHDAADKLARDAARLDEPELRLLLAVIAAFFALAPGGDRAGTAHALGDLLERAYRAEMRSVSNVAMTREEAFTAAREKSTLPFAAIGAIARSDIRSSSYGAPQVDRLVEDVSVAFWLTDDLVDAVADFRGGALNALLVDACGTFGPDGYAGRGEGLVRFLDEGILEDAAREVGARLTDAVDILAATEAKVGQHLAEVLVGAARDWIQ